MSYETLSVLLEFQLLVLDRALQIKQRAPTVCIDNIERAVEVSTFSSEATVAILIIVHQYQLA